MSGLIQAVHKKTTGSHVALRRNISAPVWGPSRSVKRCSKSCSLHSKKIFLLGGCGFLVSDVISFWPTSPGPRHQPLDGSISLKFLLDSRLQSESL